MFGSSTHTMDQKGRLFAPARFQEKLGDTVYVTIYEVEGRRCLIVFSEEGWKAFSEKVGAVSYKNKGSAIAVIGLAAQLELDSQKRFLLPQALRDYAGLKRDVVFVGHGGHAEIWDSDTWNGFLAAALASPSLANLFEELAP
ncbi:MAG: division/cell wall cluster transcriptional repressor MraZ [Firmicutes bacterium]|nr:division/cell wall cluster transcriptional repressor MraZ [Bacillota bacterium]